MKEDIQPVSVTNLIADIDSLKKIKADERAASMANIEKTIKVLSIAKLNMIVGYNTRHDTPDTLLLAAIRNKELEVAKLLINAGADINLKIRGNSAFIEALRIGDSGESDDDVAIFKLFWKKTFADAGSIIDWAKPIDAAYAGNARYDLLSVEFLWFMYNKKIISKIGFADFMQTLAKSAGSLDAFFNKSMPVSNSCFLNILLEHIDNHKDDIDLLTNLLSLEALKISVPTFSMPQLVMGRAIGKIKPSIFQSAAKYLQLVNSKPLEFDQIVLFFLERLEKEGGAGLTIQNAKTLEILQKILTIKDIKLTELSLEKLCAKNLYCLNPAAFSDAACKQIEEYRVDIGAPKLIIESDSLHDDYYEEGSYDFADSEEILSEDDETLYTSHIGSYEDSLHQWEE